MGILRPEGAMTSETLAHAVKWDAPIWSVLWYHGANVPILIFPLRFDVIDKEKVLIYETKIKKCGKSSIYVGHIWLNLFNIGAANPTLNYLFTDKQLALNYIGSNPCQ